MVEKWGYQRQRQRLEAAIMQRRFFVRPDLHFRESQREDLPSCRKEILKVLLIRIVYVRVHVIQSRITLIHMLETNVELYNIRRDNKECIIVFLRRIISCF